MINGWLLRDDILVCDNAALHEKGYNCDLGDWLWNVEGFDGLGPLNILLLPLPTRSPELNPIELIWNTVVQRMKARELPTEGGHTIALQACDVMNEIEVELVEKTYRHCGLRV